MKTFHTKKDEFDRIIERLNKEYKNAVSKEERKEILSTLMFFKAEKKHLACSEINNSVQPKNVLTDISMNIDMRPVS